MRGTGDVAVLNLGDKLPVARHAVTPLKALSLVVLLSACAEIGSKPRITSPASNENEQMLFDVATTIQDQWEQLPVSGQTEYQLALIGDRIGIRARGKGGASGLARVVDLDAERCPTIEWSWRVDRLQASADLRSKAHEDVAASIFVMFGDPGLFSMPKSVPTIRYVWTNEKIPVGAIIDNPYLPGVVRSIVVQSGNAAVGSWVTEQRDLYRDFVDAFNATPSG